MTFYHFVNCLALTFAPAYLVHKALVNDFSYQQAAYVFLAYLMTQFIKLILEGSVVGEVAAEFSLRVELIRAFIGLFEFVTIGYLLSRRQNRLSVGLNWAVSESLIRRLAPLAKDARGEEFSFDNLQMAVDANISILYYLTVAVLLSFLVRPNISPSLQQVAKLALFLAALWHPLKASLVSRLPALGLGSPSFLGFLFSLVWVGALAFLTNSLAKQNMYEKNK